MSNNWLSVNLEDIQSPKGRAIVSGPFGSNIGMRFFVPEGVPVIRGNNLTTDLTRFIDDGFVFVTEEKAKELGNCEAVPGDLIFTAAGSLGQVGIIPDKPKYPKYIISNKQLRARLDPEKVDKLFVFYWLSSPQMVEHIQLQNTGSSVPLINLSIIRKLPVPLPPLPEQRAIAGILGALDDKIELNRRMNRTLEAMARAVFRQWFVNDQDIQEWDMCCLRDIAYVVKGVSYRSADLVEDSSTALVTLKSMERGGGYREDGLKPYAGKYQPEQRLSPGEVVVAHTDLTQAADVIGRAARIEPSEKHPNLVASLDMAIVRPKEKPYTNEYLYGLLSQTEFSDHAYGYTNGTTVLHLSTKALPEYQFRVPPKSKVEEYSKLIMPIFQRIDNNKKESRTLSSLRDTLLPKLMRGEVRVAARDV